MATDESTSFGVFKPTGHTVISFPGADQAAQARTALAALGLGADGLRSYTDREMLSQIERDLQQASPLASIGQEMNLVLAHQALAERGYHWLIAHTPDDDLARRVADCVKPLGAERAQLYGRFIIEELIEHEGEPAQVSESPDRKLDAGTASGHESERAALRPAEPPDDPPR